MTGPRASTTNPSPAPWLHRSMPLQRLRAKLLGSISGVRPLFWALDWPWVLDVVGGVECPCGSVLPLRLGFGVSVGVGFEFGKSD